MGSKTVDIGFPFEHTIYCSLTRKIDNIWKDGRIRLNYYEGEKSDCWWHAFFSDVLGYYIIFPSQIAEHLAFGGFNSQVHHE